MIKRNEKICVIFVSFIIFYNIKYICKNVYFGRYLIKCKFIKMYIEMMKICQ